LKAVAHPTTTKSVVPGGAEAAVATSVRLTMTDVLGVATFRSSQGSTNGNGAASAAAEEKMTKTATTAATKPTRLRRTGNPGEVEGRGNAAENMEATMRCIVLRGGTRNG
jgi:hypothetical protein